MANMNQTRSGCTIILRWRIPTKTTIQTVIYLYQSEQIKIDMPTLRMPRGVYSPSDLPMVFYSEVSLSPILVGMNRAFMGILFNTEDGIHPMSISSMAVS